MTPVTVLAERLKTVSLRALALELAVSAAYLSDIMNGKRTAGPKVLDALGLEKVTRIETIYRRRRK